MLLGETSCELSFDLHAIFENTSLRVVYKEIVYKEDLVFCGVVALEDWAFVSDVSIGQCCENANFVGLFCQVLDGS